MLRLGSNPKDCVISESCYKGSFFYNSFVNFGSHNMHESVISKSVL